MPCNCGRRNIQQTVKKIQPTEKKPNVVNNAEKIKLHDPEPIQINSLSISQNSLHINYKGGHPSDTSHQGLLSTTAYNASGGKDGSFFKNGGRSVGYYGIGFGGGVTDQAKAVENLSLSEIDLSQYTHINVAFLAIDSKGSLSLPNSFSSRGSGVTNNLPPWIKAINNEYKASSYYKSDPDMLSFNYVKYVFKGLNKQRNNSNNQTVKIIPSIGGWNIANNTGANTMHYGNNMHATAKGINEEGSLYSKFSKNVTELLKGGLIDGIDIDWEYPGRQPIESMCLKSDGTKYPCKVSDPTQIGPCNDGDTNCSSFAYTKKSISSCNGETYREPISKGGDKWDKESTIYYSNFMKQLKEDITKANSKGELSVACAGAPWGLHWYANTLANLLKDNTITYANIMAYDYNGFWSSGQISGFLANFTNMNKLDTCSNLQPEGGPTCNTPECAKAYNGVCSNCPSSAKCGSYNGTLYECVYGSSVMALCAEKTDPECTKGEYAKFWDNCTNSTKMTFNNNNNNLVPDVLPDSCPLILYNQLGDSSLQDVTEQQRQKFIYDGNQGNWYSDFNKPVNAKKVSSSTARITLSVQTMLNIFTDVFNIDKKQLVVGLPYYGRTFQTGHPPESEKGYVTPQSNSFDEGSYGLFQQYQYGQSYSFTDIYQTNYLNQKGKNVYNIQLSDNYQESIVYAKGGDELITKITDGMSEEMISFNSIESIEEKVTWIKEKGYGGYMCWHMLSDYYNDLAK